MAAFFYWYDDESGAHLRNPATGEWQVTVAPPHVEAGNRTPGYTWKNRAWARRELLDMTEAGIDVATAVWFGHEGRGTWTEEGLKNLLEAALELEREGKHPPKIACFFDTSSFTFEESQRNPGKPWTLNLREEENKRRFYEMIRNFYTVAAEVPYRSGEPPLNLRLSESRFSPILARIDGFPVIVLYEAGRGNFFSDWDHSLFDRILSGFEADFGERPRLFPDYEWWYKNPHRRDVPFDLNGGGYVRWRAAVYEPFSINEPPSPPRKLLDAIQFGPGYDDRLFPERTRNGSPVRSRDNGYFYCYGWQYAHRSGKRLVMLESWNELHEGTAISDSRQFGRTYIQLTRSLADEFRRSYKDAESVSCRLIGSNEAGMSIINQERGLYQVDGGVLRASDQPFNAEETDYLSDPPPPTDGKTLAAWRGGSACRRTNLPEGSRIYFDIRDEFTSATTGSVLWVTVDYCDVGTDSLRLIWNNGASPPLRKSGSSEWRRWTIAVPTTGMANSLGVSLNHMVYQKLGTDFAVDSMGDGDEYIRLVSVTRKDFADESAPAPADEFEGKTFPRDNGFRLEAPSAVSKSEPFSVRLTALRPDGTVDTSYTGSIILRGSNEWAEFPSYCDFRAEDRGSVTVSGKLGRYGVTRLRIQDEGNSARASEREIFVPVPRCEVVLDPEYRERGIRLQTNDPAGRAQSGNRGYRSTADGKGRLVFDVSDALYFSLGKFPSYYHLYVTIEYLDTGTAPFRLVYDSNDEFDPPAGQKIARTQVVHRANTGGWRQHTFYLEDPFFANRCRGGDFALEDLGAELRVRRAGVGVASASPQPLRLFVERTQPASGADAAAVKLRAVDDQGKSTLADSLPVRLVWKDGSYRNLLLPAGDEATTTLPGLTADGAFAYALSDPSISSFDESGFSQTPDENFGGGASGNERGMVPRCEAFLGPKNVERGMRLIGWGTDPRAGERQGGAWCRSTRIGNGRLVFDAQDSYFGNFHQQSDHASVWLTLEYFDSGRDKFRISYDGAGEAPGKLKTRPDLKIKKQDTRAWKRVSFEVKDARFANQVEGGGDLLLDDNGDGVEYIRRVALTVTPESGVRGRVVVTPLAQATSGVVDLRVEVLGENKKRMADFAGALVAGSLPPELRRQLRRVELGHGDGGTTVIRLVSSLPPQQLAGIVQLAWERDPLISTFQASYPPRPKDLKISRSHYLWDRYRVHLFAGVLCAVAALLIGSLRWRETFRLWEQGRHVAHCRVAGLFLILALIMTYPHLFVSYSALNDMGDAVLVAWVLEHGFLRLSSDWSHFFDANIFYPERNTLAYSEHMISAVLPMLPLARITDNPILCYNALEFLSFWLSAFGMYWYAFWLTRKHGPAILAGCFYGFYGNRIPQLAHLQTVSTELIPFCFYYLHRFLAEGSRRLVPRLVLATAAQMLISGYTAVLLTYTLGLFGLSIYMGTKAWRNPRKNLCLVAAAAALALLLIPFYEPYIRFAQETKQERSLSEVAAFSPSLAEYFSVPPKNRLYGELLSGFWTRPAAEAWLFFGFVPLLLGCVGAVRMLRRVEGSPLPANVRLAGITCGFLLLLATLFSFGPVIRVGSWETANHLFVWAYEHLPGISKIRVPQRICLVSAFFLGCLLALGAVSALGNLGRRIGVPVFVVAGLLILAEHACFPLGYNQPAPPHGSYRPLGWALKTPGTTRPVYDWLQKQSEIDAIVELPYPDQYYDLQYMHHSLTHGKRLLNGFSGYYPKDYPKGRELLTRFPSVESLAFLRAKKIGWVVLHQEAYPAAEWAALQARIAQHMGEITLMYSGGGSHVLKLVPQVGR